ncbi:hypothetical protein PsYK624_116100 [Phanerochaete sordida]|uniref:Uncharacterized protein n=1 Tax=Phanerochaete sordida TaxID=48140 RepID=A0A9P3LHD4_9APHY|nr:hypothetical protein PsYK624_116100 [Phanerochaete sordida]
MRVVRSGDGLNEQGGEQETAPRAEDVFRARAVTSSPPPACPMILAHRSLARKGISEPEVASSLGPSRRVHGLLSLGSPPLPARG